MTEQAKVKTVPGPMGRPRTHFREEDRSTWEPIMRRMALKRMTVKQIGARFNCPTKVMFERHDIMTIVRECWATYDEKLIDQMLALAEADPELFKETADRNQVRNIQARAIQYLHSQMQAIASEELETNTTPVTPADIKLKISRLIGLVPNDK